MEKKAFSILDIAKVQTDLENAIKALDGWQREYQLRAIFARGGVNDSELAGFLTRSERYLAIINNDMNYLQEAIRACMKECRNGFPNESAPAISGGKEN